MNHGKGIETLTGDKIIPVNLAVNVCYKGLVVKSRSRSNLSNMSVCGMLMATEASVPLASRVGCVGLCFSNIAIKQYKAVQTSAAAWHSYSVACHYSLQQMRNRAVLLGPPTSFALE